MATYREGSKSKALCNDDVVHAKLVFYRGVWFRRNKEAKYCNLQQSHFLDFAGGATARSGGGLQWFKGLVGSFSE